MSRRGCAPNPMPTLVGPRRPTPRRRGAHVRALARGPRMRLDEGTSLRESWGAVYQNAVTAGGQDAQGPGRQNPATDPSCLGSPCAPALEGDRVGHYPNRPMPASSASAASRRSPSKLHRVAGTTSAEAKSPTSTHPIPRRPWSVRLAIKPRSSDSGTTGATGTNRRSASTAHSRRRPRLPRANSPSTQGCKRTSLPSRSGASDAELLVPRKKSIHTDESTIVICLHSIACGEHAWRQEYFPREPRAACARLPQRVSAAPV